MTVTTLILARHGETDYNAERRFQGHLPVPLNARGREQAHELAAVAALGPADVTALVIPIPHAFGLACLLSVLQSGGSATLVDGSFSLVPLIEAIERSRATVLHGSPTLFSALLAGASDALRRIRTGFVGGAHCPPDVLRALEG